MTCKPWGWTFYSCTVWVYDTLYLHTLQARLQTSAPVLINIFTTLLCPFWLAMYRGVAPSCVRRITTHVYRDDHKCAVMAIVLWHTYFTQSIYMDTALHTLQYIHHTQSDAIVWCSLINGNLITVHVETQSIEVADGHEKLWCISEPHSNRIWCMWGTEDDTVGVSRDSYIIFIIVCNGRNVTMQTKSYSCSSSSSSDYFLFSNVLNAPFSVKIIRKTDSQPWFTYLFLYVDHSLGLYQLPHHLNLALLSCQMHSSCTTLWTIYMYMMLWWCIYIASDQGKYISQ